MACTLYSAKSTSQRPQHVCQLTLRERALLLLILLLFLNPTENVARKHDLNIIDFLNSYPESDFLPCVIVLSCSAKIFPNLQLI